MDCSKLYQDKYLQFFNNKTFNKTDKMFDLFLNEVTNFFENTTIEFSPIKVVKSLRKKFSVEKTMDIIKLLNQEIVKGLSTLEIITLLWYCSCKNTLLFVYAFYIERAKDGSIALLLNELHNRKA